MPPPAADKGFWGGGDSRWAREQARLLGGPAGTTAVVLHTNEQPMVEFRYAEDGRLVTGINTLLSLRPEDRTGSEPHRFDAPLRALEADPDSGDYGPLGPRGLLLPGR